MIRLVAAAALVVATGAVAGVPAQASGPCAEATIRGTDRDDRLRGTAGPDVIVGEGGDDTILGLGGDDVLCGGGGQDQLAGGPGDDVLDGGLDAKVAEDTAYYVYYGDELDGGPGDDVLEGGLDPRHDGSHDRLSYANATGPVLVDLPSSTVTGEGTDRVVDGIGAVVGGPYDDLMTGSDGPDVLYGGPGSDRITGGRGDDELTAGGRFEEEPETAPNTMLGGPGRDSIFGGEGDDLARGGSGKDFLQMEGGADRSYGGAGGDGINDEAVAPGDGQVLDGGPGEDYLAGLGFVDRQGRWRGHVTGRHDMTAGTVVARVGSLTWSLTVSDFEDVGSPRSDLWTVLGTDGPDRIMAGFFGDPVRIYARGGNDRIYGSDQDDVLNGGPGFDSGTGWGGDDRIVSLERILGGR